MISPIIALPAVAVTLYRNYSAIDTCRTALTAA